MHPYIFFKVVAVYFNTQEFINVIWHFRPRGPARLQGSPCLPHEKCRTPFTPANREQINWTIGTHTEKNNVEAIIDLIVVD